jgi:hypothetical protein
MAPSIKSGRLPAARHLQICLLHGNTRNHNCWGTRSRGGICRNKARQRTVPGYMPTCQLHRLQLKKSARCKAQLACGFICGELVQWEPHGFRLCPLHRKDLMASYFLGLPLEIRCRIYSLLLPDTDVPATFTTSRSLTTHGGLVYTAILRVSRQIHEEAAGCLYATNKFVVSVSEGTLSMCNRRFDRLQYVRRRLRYCRSQLMP